MSGSNKEPCEEGGSGKYEKMVKFNGGGNCSQDYVEQASFRKERVGSQSGEMRNGETCLLS